MNKRTLLPLYQQRTLDNSTLNEPAAVAMTDVVNPGDDDPKVGLQTTPEPGIYMCSTVL